ncbi:multiprotein-bridging factor 1 [Cryptococcus gattii Ru294]|uniref:Multiprotein-bridging factor 1 n=2 Tax=Cryptococcus gattii TaxID=37769 RepID=E6R4Z3_CRYGW|nr:MBF1, putative [Cryptococcus gattii WM276]KIR56921.1 multiprotein-bridging factor 1 [Cryptococcus gattii Ru294]KIR80554.1 multiprotein-bridging factor 1 [Cryptococcus gattii EJB2]KIR89080.1 multiprotein-bridging factor 1 [Cryptococcus tetragattii IND107]KIY33599.1 multiprotein-bridging factor 1 [Cryptococcus gattii E566]KJE03492.1 multiprotein-bridging factor 1 [Cryptococcus gattii NT-10]
MSDWDKPTIIGFRQQKPTVAKGSSLNAAQRAGLVLSSESKGAGQSKGPADHQRIAKLDRDDAPKPPEKVSADVGKAVATARMAIKNAEGKSMTQKELATSVNAKPQDIADLESGRAVPDQALLGKLERKLNVKLRGAKNLIGTPLHPKKK